MFATLIKLFKNEDGATAIEYGLIAALIAVAAVTVLGTVGTRLTSTFQTVADKLLAFRRLFLRKVWGVMPGRAAARRSSAAASPESRAAPDWRG